MKPVIITDGFLNDEKTAVSYHAKVRSELHAKQLSHPNLHEPKLHQPYNFTIDLQQQCSYKIVEYCRKQNEVDRWKSRHWCPYYILHIYYEKRSSPYTTGRLQKNRHLNNLSCSQTQLQFGSNTIYERCKGAPSLAIPASFLVSLVTFSNCNVGYPERVENAFRKQSKHVATFNTFMFLTVMFQPSNTHILWIIRARILSELGNNGQILVNIPS